MIATLDQVIRSWSDKKPTKVFERGSKETLQSKVDDLRKAIIHHHVNQAQPYIYSLPVIKIDDEGKVNKVFITKFSIAMGISGFALSVFIFLKSRPHFQKAWKKCIELAEQKKYSVYWLGLFKRYATASDIWSRYGPTKLFHIRNATCLALPPVSYFLAKFILNKMYPPFALTLSRENYKRPLQKYIKDKIEENLSLEKYERPRPKNIEDKIKDNKSIVDPFTTERIPVNKLQSPQYLHFSNAIIDIKAYLHFILPNEKSSLIDPMSTGVLSEKDKTLVITQIEKIFLITDEQFQGCFLEQADLRIKKFEELTGVLLSDDS